jgi:3-hydroxyacyl-CoA dehydrogenase
LNDMIKKNKLGNKTKEGFYNYELWINRWA